MRTLVICFAILTLAACAGRTEPYKVAPLPTGSGYGSALPFGSTAYSNLSLASIFTRLTHGLEWGGRRPNLVRFEGPVTVSMRGSGSAQYGSFLESFLQQIRDNASIDITTGTEDPSLTVNFVPGEEFFEWNSNQCVIIPGSTTWEQVLDQPDNFDASVFETGKTLPKLSIIIPDTAPPHEVRECLMEEITQALGPANDLYGLSASIFNDDNAHAWPTSLDYLMLRVLYDPRMQTGLSWAETQARALEILDDINPDGHDAPPLPAIRQEEFLEWRGKLQRMPTLGEGVSTKAAEITGELLKEASSLATGSTYHCEAFTLHGIAKHYLDHSDALRVLGQAKKVCARAHGQNDIRIAQIKLFEALELSREERYRDALDRINGLEAQFLAVGQEGMAAGAYVVAWVANLALGNVSAARVAREKSLEWSAYAFGADSETVALWELY
jgi:hypothetical protein